MTDNPYSAPLEIETPKPITLPKNTVDFGEIIRCWERRRIFYNLALIFVTLFAADIFAAYHAPILLLGTILAGAAGANILFFYGPVFDGYLQWMGLRHPVIGRTIFAMGTILAAVLAVTTIASLASASF